MWHRIHTMPTNYVACVLCQDKIYRISFFVLFEQDPSPLYIFIWISLSFHRTYLCPLNKELPYCPCWFVVCACPEDKIYQVSRTLYDYQTWVWIESYHLHLHLMDLITPFVHIGPKQADQDIHFGTPTVYPERAHPLFYFVAVHLLPFPYRN